ncbi:Putative peptidoglycan binding domain-containing protein [Terribacillus aidingensis]|uniref:N-acetylmuramoyl-L-alanine amidase n=1 Tax=Terribacillus aidingensis TaxID=586416 RepID=A0A285NQJ5_9BACI|nr:N-acetylmuramoyl-L-alanine amidase [Terribacillus aidingensis]SNZ09901.1 Putative peptidoglycan binding domain-containing protein [Terribacillus aidingensis]
MGIKVKKDFVSKSKYSIKCPNTMSAKYITFHNTANDASAQSEINYMKNNNNEVSYHYAVDDKQVIQGIPENRNAWHCGDGSGVNSGNRTSIGVEVCYSKSGGARYKAAEKLAIKFIAQLLHKKGWGINRVKKHQEWSGKYCPHRVLDEGRWNEVKQAIANELASLKGGKAEAVKKETKSSTSGSKGNANVREAQAFLNSRNYPRKAKFTKLIVDGYTGPKSLNAALRILQYYGGTDIDGIWGPKTQKATKVLSVHSYSKWWTHLAQSALVLRGVYVSIDGVYGSGTKAGVIKFQKSKKLIPDGIIGPQTWKALVG